MTEKKKSNWLECIFFSNLKFCVLLWDYLLGGLLLYTCFIISNHFIHLLNNKIIPGNSKTLWDATKIAMDKEIVDIPSTVHLGQATSNGEDIPEAFAQYFKDKVQNISNSTTIDEEVFNGSKLGTKQAPYDHCQDMQYNHINTTL